MVSWLVVGVGLQGAVGSQAAVPHCFTTQALTPADRLTELFVATVGVGADTDLPAASLPMHSLQHTAVLLPAFALTNRRADRQTNLAG